MRVETTGWSTSHVLALLFRLILGALFLYAGIPKIADPHGFAQAVYNYRLLPGYLIAPAAIVLPFIEVLIGASLLLGIFTQGGALVVSGLLVVFLCALGISLLRGLDISCGCFSTSSSSRTIAWIDLIRNTVLLGMGLYVFFLQRGWKSVFKRTSGH
jgi:uncharacterized membrane protein YphA (DoxX/SURF4 family)